MLSPHAAMTCDLGKVWSSLGAYPLKSFINFDFLRPARFSAVYFPAWFVTGEVEASVTYKGIQVRSIFRFLNLDQFTIHFDCYRSRKVPGSTIRA